MTEKLSIAVLRVRAGYKASKLAREADVSTASIYRLEHGERVSRELVNAVLLVLNSRLGTSYKLEDIGGLNLPSGDEQ